MKKKNKINKAVFIPSLILSLLIVIIGLINTDVFTAITKKTFEFILTNFGWLFQLVSMLTLMIAIIIFISKFGNIRFGGPKAKPKFSIFSWAMMAIMGGVSTGLITYGTNEPLIYFGDIYGELEQTGIEPMSSEAASFALGRVFYNWSFIPYAIYTVVGVLLSYLYFNKRKKLTIAASIAPVLGEKITNSWFANVINILSLIAITLGLAASFGIGLTLISSGLQYKYGIQTGLGTWTILAITITFTFTFSAYTGLNKGIKYLADFKGYIYIALLALIFIAGPTLDIMGVSLSGLKTWFSNFFNWGFDSGSDLGESLVHWWTLYDWAFWIAYAPLMGIFFAMISYGRTIREFMIVNWIIPSLIAIIWFGIWGVSALHMQESGVDLVGQIAENGAVSGLWMFIDNMSFFGLSLGWLFIPIMIITLSLTLIVASQSSIASISSLCTKDYDFNVEPPGMLKIIWGVIIGIIGFVLIAYAGGEQGVDGVKYMATIAGFVVLFIFILQLISVVKTFFFEKVVESPDEEDDLDDGKNLEKM